jgi:hypothetical protein
MPWTLYRYMLWEMLRLLGLSATVLTVVVSLAASVKPLMEGLLGPVMLVRFVGLTAPLILQFTLPFAAAFSTAVSLSRMSNDNELLACWASGMSHRVVLLPAAALGLGLTVGMFWASNTVVPVFYGQAKRLATQDFLSLLVGRVRQREAVRVGERWWVYADEADDSSPPPAEVEGGVAPTQMIVLRGVAVGQATREGGLVNESTADRAVLLLFEHEGDTWVTLRLSGVQSVGVQGGRGGSGQVDVARQRLPNPFRDHVDFKTLAELRELGRDPSGFREVRDARAALVSEIASHQLLQRMEAALRTGPLTLRSGDRLYRVLSPSVARRGSGVVLTAGAQGPVDVTLEREEGPGGEPRFLRSMTAGRAELTIDDEPTAFMDTPGEPRVRVSLSSVRVTDGAGDDPGNEMRELELAPAAWHEAVAQPLRELGLSELLAHPLALAGGPRSVTRAAQAVREATVSVARDIVGQFNLRAAHAGTCALAVLASALIAMRKRGSLPLVVFFQSFALTVGVFVLILCGKTLVMNQRVELWVGVALSWAGVVAMLVYLGWSYLRLARN